MKKVQRIEDRATPFGRASRALNPGHHGITPLSYQPSSMIQMILLTNLTRSLFKLLAMLRTRHTTSPLRKFQTSKFKNKNSRPPIQRNRKLKQLYLILPPMNKLRNRPLMQFKWKSRHLPVIQISTMMHPSSETHPKQLSLNQIRNITHHLGHHKYNLIQIKMPHKTRPLAQHKRSRHPSVNNMMQLQSNQKRPKQRRRRCRHMTVTQFMMQRNHNLQHQ